MIAKKNSRYDLERKRIVFFQIGLFATGAFTLAAFTYKTPIEFDTRKKDVAYQQVVMIEEDVKEIPKQEDPIVKQLPQPPSSSTATVSTVILPSDLIDPSKNIKTDPTVGIIVDPGTIKIGDINNTGIIPSDIEIVEIPDVEASYKGGYPAMMQFINDNIHFPQEAIDLNIQGRVYISFVVEKDGSVSNVQIERGVYKSIDREATRLVRSFPEWTPGEVKASKVRTRVRLPINFTLE